MNKNNEMNVPLLDLKPQLNLLKKELHEAILAVVDSTKYIMGPQISQIEEAICEYTGVKHAVAVSSGTDALLLALMALEVEHGDWVVTTPYSFFATAGVISRLGAKPVFIDIDPVSYNLDPNLLEEYFKGLPPDDIKKIKAIIPVHLYGQCADMEPILEISNRYGIPVVEDAAQAIGAEYPGKNDPSRAGSMGAMGCFSFFPSKNLGAMGDGGMVCTNDGELAEKLKIKRVHGTTKSYFHKVIGGNFRMDTIQAAVLLVKLPHLDQWHQQRQENADFYGRLLKERKLEQISPPTMVYRNKGLKNHHIFNQYIIRSSKRDQLKEFLIKKNVGCAIYYPLAFHQQECFKHLGYKAEDFGEASRAANETLALPIYPDLTQEMLTYVVDIIQEFFTQ